MSRTLIALGASLTFFAAGVAFAQTDASTTQPTITFPIAELGSCASRAECKAYCDVESHRDACLSYAETHGLMKKEDTDKARAVLATKGGPGGCTSPSACKAYCADATHQDECMSFAAEHGLLNAAQKSLVQDIKQNGGPGGCTSPVACREYCADKTHADECKAFAEEHGLKPQSGQLMPKGNGAMGSTTREMMRNGSSTLPAALRQKLEERAASSTLPKLPPMHKPVASTTRPMMRPGAGVPGDAESGMPPVPADTGTAAPAGGAGVLWGIMHFFGVK